MSLTLSVKVQKGNCEGTESLHIFVNCDKR